jgi:arylsulfatase A-like enzyme
MTRGRVLRPSVRCRAHDGAVAPRAQQPSSVTQLVIVVDGLRPDYVTPAVMPRLFRLGQRGIVFRAHHAVFPTVTRVNASSFVTGTYPENHGVLGNDIYIPSVNASAALDTGERKNLEAVARADGWLLGVPTLGEIMQRAGRNLLAVSSGSTGSAFLLNHTAGTGALIQSDYTLPPELGPRLLATLGPPPPHAIPNDGRTSAIDAYLTIGLEELRPAVTFMWINDPDETAHAQGIGSDLTRLSLSLVDGGIGRVEDALRAKGLLNRTNILVTSDPGFSTHTGTLKLEALVEPFVKSMLTDRRTWSSRKAIHLRTRDAVRVAAIVAELQRRPEVGDFTRPARAAMRKAWYQHALVRRARWNHPRSGDIWSRTGRTQPTTPVRERPHRAASPGTALESLRYHNTLIAVGPDFREHATSDVPTGNVDIATTCLIAGRSPPTMEGRVIDEALRNKSAQISYKVERTTETVRTPDGRYELTAHLSVAAGHRYLDFTEAKRK